MDAGGYQRLEKRVKGMVAVMIIGLVLAGLTAIPLVWELDLLVSWFGQGDGWMAVWVRKVHQALHHTSEHFPFLHYGTDWLAFGHVVIAMAFWGTWKDPVRNRWLFQFGMISCVAILPWALVFGEVRGIPMALRFIDCLFGIFGFVPMWLGWKWTGQMEQMK